jgi:hypothetical protein
MTRREKASKRDHRQTDELDFQPKGRDVRHPELVDAGQHHRTRKIEPS